VKPIHLIPLGNGTDDTAPPGLEQLEYLAAALARTFKTPCQIRPEPFDVAFAADPRRGQYYSTAILQEMERRAGGGVRVLGVTSCDLYVPVLTFVFGEAQLDGGCALVSTARLREEFYGLPANEDILRGRLVKEAAHELGHTFGLRHCPEWSCVMASSHGVERLDIKRAEFCADCRKPIDGERYW